MNISDPSTDEWHKNPDHGIVIGITNGYGGWSTGSVNFSPTVSGAEFGTALIAYEICCKNDNPDNPDNPATCRLARIETISLILIVLQIVFNPDDATGFLVSKSIKSGAGKGGTGKWVAGGGSSDRSIPFLPLFVFNFSRIRFERKEKRSNFQSHSVRKITKTGQ
jgi:hypothetical protein